MQIWINFGLKLLKIVEELRIVKPCKRINSELDELGIGEHR